MVEFKLSVHLVKKDSAEACCCPSNTQQPETEASILQYSWRDELDEELSNERNRLAPLAYIDSFLWEVSQVE